MFGHRGFLWLTGIDAVTIAAAAITVTIMRIAWMRWMVAASIIAIAAIRITFAFVRDDSRVIVVFSGVSRFLGFLRGILGGRLRR